MIIIIERVSTLVMQALVDHRGMFLDIYLGWPGEVHDARGFSNSSLYAKGQQGTLVPNWTKCLNGVDVPLCILGDPAYPSLPWLIKAYPEHDNMSREQKYFNYRQSRAQMVVENAFGQLKGRWRCLLKRNDCRASNVLLMTTACVVLHNLCEAFNDDCLAEWTIVDETTTSPSVPSGIPSRSATTVRNAIATPFITTSNFVHVYIQCISIIYNVLVLFTMFFLIFVMLTL